MKSKLLLTILSFNLSLLTIIGQVPKDLVKSVPAWMAFDSSGHAVLNWLPDPSATKYEISTIAFKPFVHTSPQGQTDGSTNRYDAGAIAPGMAMTYIITKNTPSGTGVGLVHAGREMPAVHQRGRCLVILTDTIWDALPAEVTRHLSDLELDGWSAAAFVVNDTTSVSAVKTEILEWYDPANSLHQFVLLLGHVPVPYSGNTAYDGHNNHYGAWPADVYYAELNGNWTDQHVNETSPSRPENRNIPGDGKFDQSVIPTSVELGIGRADFSHLPEFEEGEIELTRLYLDKLHRYKMGQRRLPGRALVENNFASFEEGFGQSAWRNFVPFFGGDSVRMGNYEVELDTSAYLCSYACGGGSYTSCGGVGTTANLWKAKALKTVFTMVFGSYFGDWDSQNNFLRAALACGDILTNAWSGRPIWQLWHMGLGEPIGYSTLFTQTINSSLLGLGFGAHSAHIALMGDPTLRLFYPSPPDTLTASFQEGDVRLAWSPAMDAGQGYAIYRKMDVGNWHLLAENLMDTSYTDLCVPAGDYHYMVKSIRLEKTGSGSFFNLSLGTHASLRIEENEWFATYFLDADEDGYGDAEQDTTACSAPLGYVQNDQDCNDSNPEINPGAEEIPNNGIDEDCDGNDLVRTIRVTRQKPIEVFPNPAEDKIHFRKNTSAPLTFQLTTIHGQILKNGVLTEALILSELEQGMYWLKIHRTDGTLLITEKILIQR